MSSYVSTVNPPLLGDNDPSPYIIRNPQGSGKIILVCDHASHYIPEKLNYLGLPQEKLKEYHMAWDIGTRQVTEKLSDILDAPAIIANYSRLVIDLNRRITHPTSIYPYTDHDVPIPGNQNISEQERLLRIEELYTPYHQKIAELRSEFFARDIIPAFISVHSFVPRFYNQIRPWELGILWVQDDRLPKPTIEYFKKEGFIVGDNEPYDARVLRGTTVDYHADAYGLPNILVEIRNDLVQTDEQCQHWAEKLGDCFHNIFKSDSIFHRYDGPQALFDPDRAQHYFDELIQKAKQGAL